MDVTRRDAFSSSSVVSCIFSALSIHSKFRHHPRPLGYICAKFHFFRSLYCWASPWREIAYSITHSVTQSSSLFDAPENAFASEQQTSHGLWGSAGLKMPIDTHFFQRVILAGKVVQTALIYSVWKCFISRHLHARLQVFVCSSYNLWLTSRHTHRQHSDQLIWRAQAAGLIITIIKITFNTGTSDYQSAAIRTCLIQRLTDTKAIIIDQSPMHLCYAHRCAVNSVLTNSNLYHSNLWEINAAQPEMCREPKFDVLETKPKKQNCNDKHVSIIDGRNAASNSSCAVPQNLYK